MKNKSKKIMRIACLILVITLVQITGITYARYISSINVTGQAEIAKWSFNVTKDGKQIRTVKLLDTVNTNSLVDGKIAPGSSGTIVIECDATGAEVNMETSIKFVNVKNKPRNLTFSYGNVKVNSPEEFGRIVDDINCKSENRVKKFTISWIWEFEKGSTTDEKLANNIIDTEDAEAITNFTFDIEVTASQIK